MDTTPERVRQVELNRLRGTTMPCLLRYLSGLTRRPFSQSQTTREGRVHRRRVLSAQRLWQETRPPGRSGGFWRLSDRRIKETAARAR